MSSEKIEAIYELRDAAENHGRVQAETAHNDDLQSRDRRLEAWEKVEQKTMQAIEACERCGHEHAENEPHLEHRGNVIEGHFPLNRGDADQRAESG